MLRRVRGECSERGQSTVEFALVFPFLLLMLFAVLFFANYALVAVDITSAADQGAQWWSEHPQAPFTQVQQVTASMSPWPSLDPSEVSLSSPSLSGSGTGSGTNLLTLGANLNLGSLLGANVCLTLLGTNTCAVPAGTAVKVTVAYPINNLYILGPTVQALINAMDRVVGGNGIGFPQSVTASSIYLTQ